VTVFAALVVLIAWVPKFNEREERLTIATAEPEIPTPDKWISCGLFEPLSVTVIVPLRRPATVGVNVTVIVQFAKAATVAQSLFCAKSPVVATLVTVSEPAPVLVKVTVCVALTTPSGWLPKLRAIVEGAGRVEKPAVTVTGVVMVTVVAALAALATGPDQFLNAYAPVAAALIGTTVPAS
jgi:hypothetical protein